MYLPSTYEAGTASPLQFWLHWRGGSANAGAALAPRLFEELGEKVGTIVVSPRGRGTSRWYVGKGHVDFRQVWRDVHASFTVDRARTYVAGHSMGGWGSFLLTILYPDRFAAALPASPPVTQGMWTGLDFAGCDDYEAGGYTPCYGGANDGDARVQHTRRLLENVRHVPWAIYHGAADELVPVSGVTRQVERLVQLGYRHRYYLFPAQEHYGPPITDEWSEGARLPAPLRAAGEPRARDLHPRHAVRARDRDDPVGRGAAVVLVRPGVLDVAARAGRSRRGRRDVRRHLGGDRPSSRTRRCPRRAARQRSARPART